MTKEIENIKIDKNIRNAFDYFIHSCKDLSKGNKHNGIDIKDYYYLIKQYAVKEMNQIMLIFESLASELGEEGFSSYLSENCEIKELYDFKNSLLIVKCMNILSYSFSYKMHSYFIACFVHLLWVASNEKCDKMNISTDNNKILLFKKNDLIFELDLSEFSSPIISLKAFIILLCYDEKSGEYNEISFQNNSKDILYLKIHEVPCLSTNLNILFKYESK